MSACYFDATLLPLTPWKFCQPSWWNWVSFQQFQCPSRQGPCSTSQPRHTGQAKFPQTVFPRFQAHSSLISIFKVLIWHPGKWEICSFVLSQESCDCIWSKIIHRAQHTSCDLIDAPVFAVFPINSGWLLNCTENVSSQRHLPGLRI